MQTGQRGNNPFSLSTDQRLLFAWICLKHDGTFLSLLAGVLAELSQPVTIPLLEERVRSIYPTFVAALKEKSTGPRDADIVRRLDDIGRRVARRATGRKATTGGVTEQTVRRLFEELLYWRLETLVDLGYLRKVDPALYNYESLPQITDLRDSTRNDLREFLETGFFLHWARAVYRKACTRLSGKDASEILMEANRQHSNQLGYTGIEEGLLIANLVLRRRDVDAVIEYRDAVDALLTHRPEYKVLTTIDRNRQLSAFKISQVGA